MTKYLTVDEAADLLRIKKQTVYKWICEKKIPSFAVGGRTLFERDEILNWISKGKREAL